MYCNRLHTWWSTQSWLATLLSSLIARGLVGLQTLCRFWLKDLSIDEMVGAWCFDCLWGPQGFTCWIAFAQVFSFIYCWGFTISPFYILKKFNCISWHTICLKFKKEHVMWQTIKGFWRSIKIATTYLFSSKACLEPLIIRRSVLWDPYPGLNTERYSLKWWLIKLHTCSFIALS